MKNVQVITNDSIKLNDNNKYTILDANGSSFEVSLTDIIDSSTDLPSDGADITDGVSEKLLNFTPNITDCVGAKITDGELLTMVNSGEAIALEVTFEATHSGLNLNDAVYTSSSLSNDAQTWMYPFPKPLIKNHYMDEEPLGRAINASFGQSEFAEDRDCIDVTYKVTDRDAMTKFADGRYKTMSIGARSGYIKCNVCGKDILKDSKVTFCGHWKGNTYAGKKATWTVENMTFREGSVVNAPADVYAQVKNIKVVKQAKEGSQMKDNQQDNDNILDAMDGILGNEGQSNDPAANNDNQPEGKEPVGAEPTNVGDDNGVNDNEGETPDVSKELEDAKATITDLEGQIATLTTDLEKAQAELTEANDNLTVSNTDNEGLQAEVTRVKDQSKRLAEFNLKLMKDSLMILNPELSDAELEGKTAREVNDMIKDLKENPQPRQLGSVANPGLATKDSNDLDNNDNDDSSEGEQKKMPTMKDYEDVVLGFMNKNN